MAQSDWSNLDDRDDADDVMETRLTIDYDKQWLNCVSAIGHICLHASFSICITLLFRFVKNKLLIR